MAFRAPISGVGLSSVDDESFCERGNNCKRGRFSIFNYKFDYFNTQVHESCIEPDRIRPSARNSSFGIINGSDDRIIITPHLMTIHLSSTMRCNFTQLSDLTVESSRIPISDSWTWVCKKQN